MGGMKRITLKLPMMTSCTCTASSRGWPLCWPDCTVSWSQFETFFFPRYRNGFAERSVWCGESKSFRGGIGEMSSEHHFSRGNVNIFKLLCLSDFRSQFRTRVQGHAERIQDRHLPFCKSILEHRSSPSHASSLIALQQLHFTQLCNLACCVSSLRLLYFLFPIQLSKMQFRQSALIVFRLGVPSKLRNDYIYCCIGSSCTELFQSSNQVVHLNIFSPSSFYYSNVSFLGIALGCAIRIATNAVVCAVADFFCARRRLYGSLPPESWGPAVPVSSGMI